MVEVDMKFIRWTGLFGFGSGLLLFFLASEPCLAGLHQQDANIREFINAVAAKNKAGAYKSMGIRSDNAAGAKLVRNGIETLGGKKIDDITRTSFQYNWTNGTESLNSAYHIRAGKEGFDFCLSFESVGKKISSIEFSFERAEADPWEVRAINFFYYHWKALLLALFLAVALIGILLMLNIRRFTGGNP
jgi:hypothetical protein